MLTWLWHFFLLLLRAEKEVQCWLGAVGVGENRAWVELLEDQKFWIKKEKNEHSGREGGQLKGTTCWIFEKKLSLYFLCFFFFCERFEMFVGISKFCWGSCGEPLDLGLHCKGYTDYPCPLYLFIYLFVYIGFILDDLLVYIGVRSISIHILLNASNFHYFSYCRVCFWVICLSIYFFIVYFVLFLILRLLVMFFSL